MSVHELSNGMGSGSSVCPVLSSPDGTPMPPFIQAGEGERSMRFPQTVFDGDELYNNRAYQLYAVQLADWVFQAKMADSGITEQMIHSVSVCMEDMLINSYCESPIEELLLAALIFQTNGYEQLDCCPWEHVEAIYNCSLEQAASNNLVSVIIPQAKIDKIVVDFLIVTNIEGELKTLIVECDGHNYHDKTKQQASNDKKRDRLVTALGHQVLRFTGSDIYNRPFACAEEISTFLGRQIDSVLEARGLISKNKKEAK